MPKSKEFLLSWSQDAQLIELVSQQPLLFDPKAESYKDQAARDRAWDQISAELGGSRDLCKKRWINIRDAYNRIRRTKKNEMVSGAKLKKPKWILYDQLHFLASIASEKTGKMLQRRWRSLRDCYMRELNTQTQPKSGSARSDRKQYIYFNQLSFLRQSVGKRKTKSSLDEDQNDITGNVDEVVDSGLTVMQADAFANVIQISPQPTPQPKTLSQPIENFSVLPAIVPSRKRSQEQAATELKVLQDISKRFCPSPESQKGHTKKAEEDEDRLFLLSLLNDVRKVDEDDKLELKSEMILLIKKWQKARQHNQFTNLSHNSQFNKGSTNFQGSNHSYEFSGQTAKQQYPNQTSSGMSSSLGRISSGSHRSTVQSPLLQISTVQSLDFSETSCESHCE